jgi:urease alpha subunit
MLQLLDCRQKTAECGIHSRADVLYQDTQWVIVNGQLPQTAISGIFAGACQFHRYHLSYRGHPAMTSEKYDLLIRNGDIIDGTGAKRVRADVGIRGDRIAAIGDLSDANAVAEENAAGRVVCPGFVDVHTHDDNSLLDRPDMFYKTSQGVTSVVSV